MDEKDTEYLSKFLEEFQSESDRGAALVGPALLDARLERLLLSHFRQGKAAEELVSGGTAPLGTFSARIKITWALGLISNSERDDMNIIRGVRNAFAHQEHGLSFSDTKIVSLCSALMVRRPLSMIEKFGLTPRQRFNDAVIGIAMQLWYRPEHAVSLKAIERVWPY